MIQLKPFLIETNNFVFTYHGGGYNLEHIQTLKRSNISSFTKKSQRRLVLYLENVVNFTPRYLFFIQFPNNPDFETAFAELKSFLRSLSREKFHKRKLVPLFIWKRLVINGCLVFEVLTNFNPELSGDSLPFILNNFWVQHNPEVKFNLLQISEDLRKLVLMDFAVFQSEDNLPNDDSPANGRWWGVVNRSAYHCKEVVKKEAPLTDILLKEIELADKEVSCNFYKK